MYIKFIFIYQLCFVDTCCWSLLSSCDCWLRCLKRGIFCLWVMWLSFTQGLSHPDYWWTCYSVLRWPLGLFLHCSKWGKALGVLGPWLPCLIRNSSLPVVQFFAVTLLGHSISNYAPCKGGLDFWRLCLWELRLVGKGKVSCKLLIYKISINYLYFFICDRNEQNPVLPLCSLNLFWGSIGAGILITFFFLKTKMGNLRQRGVSFGWGVVLVREKDNYFL